MNQKPRAALLGALLAVPFAALAQQSPRLPDSADPGAAVMPIVYESVVSPVVTRPSPEPQGSPPTPDKLWRAANETVGAPARRPAPADHGKHHQAGHTR